VINPSKAFKQQFLDEQGIFILKSLLSNSFHSKDFEIYFYCLGLIPSISSVNVKDFFEQGYIALLVSQLGELYEQSDML